MTETTQDRVESTETTEEGLSEEGATQEGLQDESSITSSTTGSEQPSQDSEEAFTEKEIDDSADWDLNKLKEFKKSLQADYTKKTQNISEKQRQVENQLVKRDQQLSQVQQMIIGVLKDPSKLEHYRQVYGPQLGISDIKTDIESKMPDIQTTDDLAEYLKQRDKNLEQKIRSAVGEENIAYRNQLQKEQRWVQAGESLKTDPVFANPNYQAIIIQMIQDPSRPYKMAYESGKMNEYDVLKNGIDEFKKLLGPELEKMKQEGAGKSVEKKLASTLKPGKAMETVPSQHLSKEQIIQRVRSKLG